MTESSHADENPWLQLPSEPPFVLSHDHAPILAFNSRASEQHQYVLTLHPEPFIGSLKASVYLLALNPGFNKNDYAWHQNASSLLALRKAAVQDPTNQLMHYLTDEFANSPGSSWWRAKTSLLIESVGIERVASSLCCIQLYPYHSREFRYSKDLLTASVLYSINNVKAAMDDKKLIVVLRSYALWLRLIPELSTYHRCTKTKNPRNPCLTPGNLVPCPASS
jgi:hypothetical protein